MVAERLKLPSHRSLRIHLQAVAYRGVRHCLQVFTRRATTEEKDRLFDLVQVTIDSVPEEEDVLIMVGDWNAKVGNTERSDTDSEWEGVRGCHGVGKMNESGERFLSFCAMNSLSILNAYF